MLENTPNHNAGDDPDRIGSRPAGLTIADAITLVQGWHDLRQKRRDALTSALRAACRIAETHPAAFELTPATLNARVLAKPSELHGIKAPAMATVRANLRYTMRRLGLLQARASLSPAWDALRASLPARAAVTLTRFLEYHSHAGIAPNAVSDATFAALSLIHI